MSSDSADQPDVAAIDFARVGIEHIGVDGGDLFASSFMWTDPEAEVVMSNADQIYDSWLDGLKAGGWDGSDEVVRLGYLIPTVRRAIMVPGMLGFVALGSEFPLERYGGSKDDMPESIRRRFEFLLPYFDETVALAR